MAPGAHAPCLNKRRFHGKKCDRPSKSNRIMKCINFNIDLMSENLVAAECPVIPLIPHVTVSIICGYVVQYNFMFQVIFGPIISSGMNLPVQN